VDNAGFCSARRIGGRDNASRNGREVTRFVGAKNLERRRFLFRCASCFCDGDEAGPERFFLSFMNFALLLLWPQI
jgi:hypothetical protein